MMWRDAVMLRQNGKDPTARRLPIPVCRSAGRNPTRDQELGGVFTGTARNAGDALGRDWERTSTMEGLVYFDLRGGVGFVCRRRGCMCRICRG